MVRGEIPQSSHPNTGDIKGLSRTLDFQTERATCQQEVPGATGDLELRIFQIIEK
jgi:hypothetical protein